MKVGILTHYNVYNQGALLQMTAMHHWLKNQGHQPVILTYEKNFDFREGAKERNSGSFWAFPYYIRHYLLEKGVGLTWFNTRKVLAMKQARKQFIYAPYNASGCDAIVIGSDEVYSIDVGINPMMYGHDLGGVPAIAYAPAFGRSTPELLEEYGCTEIVRSGLAKMAHLSARDIHTRDMVQAFTGRDVPMVCDPVLLYSGDYNTAHKPIGKPYLAVYAYDSHMIDPAEIKAIRSYAKAHGLITVSLGTYHSWCDRNIVCSAEEWYGYFEDAACVVTDTFHGSVVAMKNHCNVAVFIRESINAFKLRSLLAETGLTDRRLEAITRENLETVLSRPIDYKAVDANIEKMTARSEPECVMKNILMVIPTLRMGGAEKSVVSLLKALDPQRVNVDLFLFEAGGVLQQEVPAWVNIVEADTVTRGMTLEIRYHLKDMLKSGHVAAAAARLWMTFRSSLRQKLCMRPPFNWKLARKLIPVLEKHYNVAVGCLEGATDYFVLDKVHADYKVGWVHTDMSKRCNLLQDAAYYERFDAMATISDICLDAFRACFPKAGAKMRVIENIVLPQDVWEKAEVPADSDWSLDRPHLITVGRLYYHKGIDVAARVCKVLKDRKVDLCWHVYGDGVMYDEIAKYVEEDDLQNDFILEGLTSNPYPYMKRADLVVQPSRLEGKSLVLDEAKILGKAIVVTNYPSVFDQIEDGKTGIITGMEPEEIADGIQRVLNDAALKRSLEENCLREPNGSIRAVNAFYEMIGA